MVAASLAIAAACTFPEPSFFVGDGGASEAGIDTSTPDADVSDGRILVDGQDPDALIVKDAGQKIDAAGCDACDCDNDGFNDTSKPGCDAGATDCDDTDPRAKPGQNYVIDPPEPPMNGNWDCKLPVERLFPPNLDCTKLKTKSACELASGFVDNPECGSRGALIQCKWACDLTGLFCECGAGTPQPNQGPQACR